MRPFFKNSQIKDSVLSGYLKNWRKQKTLVLFVDTSEIGSYRTLYFLGVPEVGVSDQSMGKY